MQRRRHRKQTSHKPSATSALQKPTTTPMSHKPSATFAPLKPYATSVPPKRSATSASQQPSVMSVPQKSSMAYWDRAWEKYFAASRKVSLVDFYRRRSSFLRRCLFFRQRVCVSGKSWFLVVVLEGYDVK